jgi:hypothetical protein
VKPTYYYPNKLTLDGNLPEADLEELYDSNWRDRARKLQARRWEKIHRLETEEKEKKLERLQQIRQKRWLQKHGWPLVSQPIV